MSDSHTPAPAATSDVSAEHVRDINHRVKGYLKIGLLQIIFTFITVGVSFVINSPGTKILITLLTAAANAVLVAGIMMHLKEEKRTIWHFLIFTGIFFFILFFLTGLAHSDMIFGSTHSHH